MKKTTLLWDWNGTLLNDVEQGVASMNELLSTRQMPLLDKKRYREIFDFPVIDYYRVLGFDFKQESWGDVAAEYMAAYHAKESSMQLFDDAIQVLRYFKEQGYRQYILSAMKTESIVTMLQAFGISEFFHAVYGLDNHYANGKVEVGHYLIETEGLLPEQCLIIGDTIHDAEVAEALNCDLVLVSQGHQSVQRLSKKQDRVVEGLHELKSFII